VFYLHLGFYGRFGGKKGGLGGGGGGVAALAYLNKNFCAFKQDDRAMKGHS